MQAPYYLKVGRASDLKDFRERMIYRALEISPGFLSWLTLGGSVLLSWLKPVWIAVFIISFASYWLFRTIYFAFLLRTAYKKMRKHEKTNWLEQLKKLSSNNWENIYHLVIFPTYKESLEILRGTFKALEQSDYPKNKMIVVLAAEESAGPEFLEIVRVIEKEFGNQFFRFLTTLHPSNLPGEIPGKGSNETWAARKAKELIIDPARIPYENIIVSSLDSDTAVFPKYFSCLAYHYLTAAKPTQTSYQPIPLFINNIWQAPAISRIFSFGASFWQFMNQERPEKQTPFSSHSMSFKALVDIDFWQTNVVSEDSRIFWNCFLFYNGDYRVQALYYPIAMDANVAPTLRRTLINMYKQQRRWAYGAGDIPYFLFGFLKNKNIFWRRKLSMSFEFIEGFWSWATASIMLFLLGWLPFILGGSQFGQTVMSYNLPNITRNILTLGMAGLILSAYFGILLLPPKPAQYGRWRYAVFALGWILVPITGIFFGSLPAIDAQTRLMAGKYMGFWPTEKFRKNFEGGQKP